MVRRCLKGKSLQDLIDLQDKHELLVYTGADTDSDIFLSSIVINIIIIIISDDKPDFMINIKHMQFPKSCKMAMDCCL